MKLTIKMEQLPEFIFNLPFKTNLLDLVVFIIITFYAYEGYVIGFRLALFDLLSFVLSFITALKLYGFAAGFLTEFTALPPGFANAIGFFVMAFTGEIVFNILLRKANSFLPAPRLPVLLDRFFKKTDHYFGLLPGMISAFIVLSFLLTVVVSLPSSPLIKTMVTDSRVGSRMVASTSLFEKKLDDIFGGALNETINFLTVEPESNKVIDLKFSVADGKADYRDEEEMLVLLNQKRVENGLKPLKSDEDLKKIARAHSDDMFLRGYFSHYTPEGISPFDRMSAEDISFTYAGENLALAPNTDLAMQGLMNSPGHRANILNPNFKKAGIGVINGGIYGKMYSQEFTD